MGTEYAAFHLWYTIPPSILLTFLIWPLATRLDWYMVISLIVIAIVSTTPWDSYLILKGIWSYPPAVVLGPTLFAIPIEEVFFFFIQTYSTSLLYLLLSKPTLHPAHLPTRADQSRRSHGITFSFAGACLSGAFMVSGFSSSEPTYLGLILVWASPFLVLLWSLSHGFLTNLPLSNTVLPIVIPTLYLWIIDTLALKRGTWAIQSGTKLSVYLWPGLEIEEAVFFLMTNMLIVFGLVAFHNAIAVQNSLPGRFPAVSTFPTPKTLLRALLTPFSASEIQRIQDIADCESSLKNKSRSFHLASAAFSGRLRLDMVSLYAFCRVADDLVDEAPNRREAADWIKRLHLFLDKSYGEPKDRDSIKHFILAHFPRKAWGPLRTLPVSRLSKKPLVDLLKGFETDLRFYTDIPSAARFQPVVFSENDLQAYSYQVAGTVAHLCIDLVLHRYPDPTSCRSRDLLISSGEQMGVALQYINISRDILADARMGRIYLPSQWFTDKEVSPASIIEDPSHPVIAAHRGRLLSKAFSLYQEAKDAIDLLPREARAPIRAAVESYMEIGRVMQEFGWDPREGRATVPLFRRVMVAWKAIQ